MAGAQRIQIGDLFENKDVRTPGRQVEVVSGPDHRNKFLVRTVVNPAKPQAVGNLSHVHVEVLRNRYKRVSI